MKPLHQRLLEAIRARHPSFAPAPESAERIARAEARLGGTLPADYGAFLSELGRVPWPMQIGNVLDFKANDWPPMFVPFALDQAQAHGFFLKPRRARFPGLAAELRERAAELEDDVKAAREEGELSDEDDDERLAEAAALRAEARHERRNGARVPATKPKLLRIECVPLDSRELRNFSLDERDAPNPFGSWLAAAVRAKLQAEQLASLPDAPEDTDARAHARVLDLLDRLVETGRLEVVGGFDEEAAASLLAPALDDAERMLALLVELPGVDEVFVSEEELQAAIALLDVIEEISEW
jgi:hypothetical protein